MARVLIVGCGCLGTELGRTLADDGWAVRGTSRTSGGAARIERSGIEGVVADPDRVGTVLEHVGDVAVVAWALGAASGPSAHDVNGPRLERMLERLVDTPVRGFVLDEPPRSAAGKGTGRGGRRDVADSHARGRCGALGRQRVGRGDAGRRERADCREPVAGRYCSVLRGKSIAAGSFCSPSAHGAASSSTAGGWSSSSVKSLAPITSATMTAIAPP